jgi:hypothetical protein
MTTFHVFSGERLVSTTHSRELAEQWAAVVRDGHVELVVRQPTAGELLAGERRQAAA